jgi:Tfp pilus assembly protein PilF
VSGIVFRIRPRGAATGSTPAADPWSEIRTAAIGRDAPHGDRLTCEVAARYWVRRGEAAFERGDRPAMTVAFDSALALAPGNADLCSYLGAFYGQNGMLAESIPLLTAAVENEPLSVRGWTNLGFALLASGRRDEGRAALVESLRIQPNQDEVRTVLRRLGTR